MVYRQNIANKNLANNYIAIKNITKYKIANNNIAIKNIANNNIVSNNIVNNHIPDKNIAYKIFFKYIQNDTLKIKKWYQYVFVGDVLLRNS